ncbi:glycosyltransferase [Thermomonospora umbrina]|uniref:Glycosyltransferase involved in cell wall biosynthesis n=1 Tax=Thermomonospora umbrina TaxID=111806 RepID=A0A3D9T3X1_9ACTN|nr:glycosyltransferase [Thermomonospora umbrina]REE98511.1 glycosyltransferase involved in cell wall biosynthesis [Thermomonospora umbrina]
MDASPSPPGPSLEIVIPAYNEARRLPLGLALLGERLKALPVAAEVIVVDNASTDETAEIVHGWRGPVPVRLLYCAERGKGAAVRTGLLATRAPYVGFCDADMATDLAALDGVLDLLAGGRSVVVGSRRHARSVVEGYGQPLRRIGALAFNLAIRDLAGGVPDTQCGFKFFAGPLARDAVADLRTTGFTFDVELLLHCVRRGAEITDVPVEWRDMPGTTFSMRRHSVGVLRDLLRIRRLAAAVGTRPAPAAPSSIALTVPDTPGPGAG